MTEWQDVRIGDLGKVVTGKTPPTSKPEYYGGTTQFLTPTDMDGRRIINQTIRYLSEEGVKKVSSSLLPKGSVSVSCIGSDMGKTVLVGEKSVTNQQINSVIVGEEFDNLFIYYNLSGRKSELQFLASGAAQPIMNKTDFSNLTINVPPLTEQKAISSVLGALDDKIENNRQMNQTLEEMARAIFKSWFVDFDPVHAKAAGNAPEHMDAETAALFPSSFGDDGLPSGWAHKTLGDLIVPKRGKTITKSKTKEGNIPVVAGGLEPAYFHNESNVEAPVVTISASGANAGFTRLYNENIWASDCSFISKQMTDVIYFWFTFLKTNQQKIYHMQQGAAQPHIYPSDLVRLELTVPKDNKLIKHFEDMISAYFKRISIAQKESKTLAELRDTLLPKLMSGEIRVKDAEREVEAAV